MKMIKLSLIVVFCVGTVFASDDIAPTVPDAVAENTSSTTVDGKLRAYYITDDGQKGYNLFSQESQLGGAATLNVSHKFTNWLSANFSAVGYYNILQGSNSVMNYSLPTSYFEGSKSGAFFNVANLTATFGDTTIVAGRQLLSTPMVQTYDWLLSLESFEAYTVVNNSIKNVTLTGAYITKYRSINSGDNYIDLTNIDKGHNWALGGAYDDKTYKANAWFYNVDAGAAAGSKVDKYNQVYIDGGTTLSNIEIDAQYAHTNFNTSKDSDLFGIKAITKVADVNLMAAYNYASGNKVGYIGIDSLYTTSWNFYTPNNEGSAVKVQADTTIAGVTATASYAYYEHKEDVVNNDKGHEFDFILAYPVTKSIHLDLIYANTDYGVGTGINSVEVFASYKF